MKKMPHRLIICIVFLITTGLSQSAEPEFEPQTIDSAIEIGYGLAVGDVNGDGREDILLADKRDFFWYENPTWERHLFWTLSNEGNKESMRDNVCIAARDIDGDGKVEVAVGTNWNPGETDSEEKSGGVWFVGSLGRIAPVKLPHEPTTHRMRWVRGEKGHSLVVAPLHGRGNKGGAGENGSRIYAYESGKNPYSSSWKQVLIEDRLHKTHNFDVVSNGRNQPDSLLLGGGEGFAVAKQSGGSWNSQRLDALKGSPGEIRSIEAEGSTLVASIEPMHGNNVVLYRRKGSGSWNRTVLDDTLNQGHALVAADFLNTGAFQMVAGWRNPDKSGKVGIRLYQQDQGGNWSAHTLDDNTMACEDLKAADLDSDGRIDLVASGRRTKNVVIYWNRSDR